MLAHEFGQVHAVVWLKSQRSTAFVNLLAHDYSAFLKIRISSDPTIELYKLTEPTPLQRLGLENCREIEDEGIIVLSSCIGILMRQNQRKAANCADSLDRSERRLRILSVSEHASGWLSLPTGPLNGDPIKGCVAIRPSATATILDCLDRVILAQPVNGRPSHVVSEDPTRQPLKKPVPGIGARSAIHFRVKEANAFVLGLNARIRQGFQ